MLNNLIPFICLKVAPWLTDKNALIASITLQPFRCSPQEAYQIVPTVSNQKLFFHEAALHPEPDYYDAGVAHRELRPIHSIY